VSEDQTVRAGGTPPVDRLGPAKSQKWNSPPRGTKPSVIRQSRRPRDDPAPRPYPGRLEMRLWPGPQTTKSRSIAPPRIHPMTSYRMRKQLRVRPYRPGPVCGPKCRHEDGPHPTLRARVSVFGSMCGSPNGPFNPVRGRAEGFTLLKGWRPRSAEGVGVWPRIGPLSPRHQARRRPPRSDRELRVRNVPRRPTSDRLGGPSPMFNGRLVNVRKCSPPPRAGCAPFLGLRRTVHGRRPSSPPSVGTSAPDGSSLTELHKTNDHKKHGGRTGKGRSNTRRVEKGGKGNREARTGK